MTSMVMVQIYHAAGGPGTPARPDLRNR
jgi:hypothetical protein